MKIMQLFDKTGSFGAIVSAMGCASCFPALGAFGSSIGLGFLAQYEGFFVNTLVPLFAGIVLFVNIISWWGSRDFPL